MILSSPFSRQNRSHRSWSNGHSNSQHRFQHGGSLRRLPPQQPAPQQPKPAPAQQQQYQKPAIGVAINGEARPAQPQASESPFTRSHTLSRLEMNRNRLQRNNNQSNSLRRNLSSLGHYPVQPNQQNNVTTSKPDTQIYAPASIASPSEFTHYKRPVVNNGNVVVNGESQHYAATSCIVPHYGATSESGKSGRESAFGSLLERFGGTLRRRTLKWPRLSPKKSSRASSGSPASFSSQKLNGSSIAASSPAPQNIPPPPLVQTALDPEIYASGKKKVEAEDIYAEGLRAIDGNIQKRLIEYELDEALMSEGESRTLIEEQSRQQPQYQQLVCSLRNWINDELSDQRIIVKDLQDDLYDGQILGKLVEKLHQIKLDIVEVTQNESIQRYKLRTVLETINRILTLQARWARIRWSVDGIHSKNMVEIIHLLITLAIYYRAPMKLPNNVTVQVLVVQKNQGQLTKRSHEAQLTNPSQMPNFDCRNGYIAIDYQSKHDQSQQRDAFDTLIEFAPQKLNVVKQSLVNFANRHLNRINMSCLANRVSEVLDPEQFSDGLLLVFLISSLEDYFVPLGNLFTTPAENTATGGNYIQMLQTAIQPNSYVNTQPIHRLHNVNVAFQLMEEAGIEIRQRVRAEDVANGDLKSVLRVLYSLFSRYKHL